MFCYIYADYFGLMAPGTLQSMLEGGGPIGPSPPATLVAASIVLAVPSVMIFLSVALTPRMARWGNIVTGAIYTRGNGRSRAFPPPVRFNAYIGNRPLQLQTHSRKGESS